MADNQRFIPIYFDRGMWTSGNDPTRIPDGYALEIRNKLLRPSGLETRPPFVYDSLMTIRSLNVFDDQTNKAQRLLSINTTPNLFMKGTSGDTWSASLGSVGAASARLTDGANYRGKFYGMLDDGAGVPTSAFSFDGTNIDTTPFNSPVQGRTITPYLDRLFIAYPRVTVTPLSSSGTTFDGYDFEAWNSSNVNVRVLTSGSRSVRRLIPTSSALTVGGIFTGGNIQSHSFEIASSGTTNPYTYRQDFQPLHASYETPMHIGVYLSGASVRLTAYAAGDIVIESDGTSDNIYRCTTAGTTAAGAPSWGVLGSTTADGTVVWTAEARAVLAVREFYLPTATEDQRVITETIRCLLPWRTNTANIRITVGYGHTAVPLTTISPVDIALKDGLGDSDLAKSNFGGQLTAGDYLFPFYNKESASTATVDLNSIVWSEVLNPKQIRASATYELQQVPGYPTAATVLGKRYLVFKRSAFWVFIGNQDIESIDVIPIRSEREYLSVGCIGPRALDSIDDDLYFVGEDGVYRFAVGMDKPEEIGGDAMREEIIDRGSNWVESQSTYNMPLLRINKRDKEVWVYTQKSKIYVYNIARKGWAYLDVADNAEIADMFFNPNTRKMYVAVGGFGLARVDWNSAAAEDTVDNTVTTYDCTKDIVTRPLETFAPRVDWLIDNVGVFHLASVAQTDQTLTPSYSLDRGTTFTALAALTLDITDPRNPIDIYQSAPSMTIKLSHVGKAGKTIWGVSKLDADIRLLSGEWPQVKPVAA